MFTISLRYSIVPTGWKVHKIVPVFKAGNPSSVKNYRPISLLSSISKVLERLVFNKIISHVNTSISPLQFGFIEKSSTLQQMLLFIDSIFNHPSQTDVIYLDISKAFDTVSHGILLSKLWHFGISGSLWAWFKNYLTNRYQSVSISNNLSHTLPVVSGVPQGSILGPVLFLIYMNDVTSSTRHSQLLIYADDTKCFKHLSSITGQIYLQEDINAIITWSKSSQLNFNISKCTHISFKPKIVSSYNLSDTAISITDFQKDLGLVVSNDLSWENHYNHIIPRAYKILGLICRSFSPSLNLSVKMKLYLTLVRSQLMYCTPIWRPYLHKDIQNTERIQRCTTKFILNDYDSNYKTRLLTLKLLRLMYLFELQDIIFTVKSLKYSTKGFNILHHISFSTSNTRSSSSHKLKHLPHTNNYNRHSFFHRLPRLWNSIPIIDLHLSISTTIIKLKEYFWNHFVSNFDNEEPCTLHLLCPCNKYYNSPPPVNFNSL